MPFDLYKVERRFVGGPSQRVWTEPAFEVAVCFVEKTRWGHVRHASLRGAAQRRVR